MPGPAITALHLTDPPERWAALGFSVAPDGTCRVGQVALRLGCDGGDGDGDGGAGIVGWTLSGSGSGDVAGVATEHDGSPARGQAPEHPNTALAVDHVVLATPDVDETLRELTGAGMTLRRERAAGSSRRPLRQAFFRHGEAILEVVGPAEPAAPAGAGERPRLWGLTVTVGDIGAAARVLGAHLGVAHDAVQPGRRIATVRESAGLSVPLAFMTPPP